MFFGAEEKRQVTNFPGFKIPFGSRAFLRSDAAGRPRLRLLGQTKVFSQGRFVLSGDGALPLYNFGKQGIEHRFTSYS